MRDDNELGLHLDSLALVEILLKITEVSKRYPYRSKWRLFTKTELDNFVSLVIFFWNADNSLSKSKTFTERMGKE